MKLKFAFSPCPNDTFMFEPIVNHRIDMEGFDFDILLDDVENLNKAALQGVPDITKLSFNAYTKLYQHYQLLNSGSALGNNCGPLLISKHSISSGDVAKIKVGIPGFNTTAFLLLKYAFPQITDFEEMIFSEIESAILENKIDAGVIIHENRFTFEQKGLVKIMDLGEYWEHTTGNAIPLGGIAIKRSLPDTVKKSINRLLFNSITFAMNNPVSGLDFIRSHAQEMDEQVMFSHINLYVNENSVQLNQAGKNAIIALFKTIHPNFSEKEATNLFVD